jgi:hypothetical protein
MLLEEDRRALKKEGYKISGGGVISPIAHPLQQTHRKSFSSGVKLLRQGNREQQPNPRPRSIQPSKALQTFRQGERDFTNNPRPRSIQPSKALQTFRKGERDFTNNPTKAIAPVVQQSANNRRLPPPSASEPPKPKPEKSWWDKAGDFVNNHASDFGHAALDVAGFVPVVGDAADLVNAGWYAMEGDWTNAALSAASAIPIVGDLAKVGKYGARVAQYTARVENAAPTIRRLTNGGSAAFDTANGVRYAVEGDWTNAGLSFVSAGVGGVVTARSLGRNRIPNNANVTGDATAGGRRLEIEGRPAIEARPSTTTPRVPRRPSTVANVTGDATGAGRRLGIEGRPVSRPAIEAGPSTTTPAVAYKGGRWRSPDGRFASDPNPSPAGRRITGRYNQDFMQEQLNIILKGIKENGSHPLDMFVDPKTGNFYSRQPEAWSGVNKPGVQAMHMKSAFALESNEPETLAFGEASENWLDGLDEGRGVIFERKALKMPDGIIIEPGLAKYLEKIGKLEKGSVAKLPRVEGWVSPKWTP